MWSLWIKASAKCINVNVKALTCMLWLKLMLFVTTAFLFLSYQVYIPSIIHISKRIYFQFYLSIYILGGRGTLVAQKNRNPRFCSFSCDCIFKIARLLCCYPGNGSLQSHCILITFLAAMTARNWCQTF